MLDFYKLIPQVESVGDQSAAELDKAALTVENALKTFAELENKSEKNLSRLLANENRPLWPVAIPLESFAQKFALATFEHEYTVIGVDGSQIMPSQHDIVHCYLLNIGVVQIDYGQSTKPIITSTPFLFHKKEQLYPLVDRRRLHIDELYVALERNLLEFEMLSQQAANAKQKNSAILALLDGSLVPWSLERMPPVYQEQYLAKMSQIFTHFKELRAPIFGYISKSRSAEVVNDMRILICPYEFSDCQTNCRNLSEDDFPCSSIAPLTDSRMFAKLLPNLNRSATFLSGSKISKLLAPDLQICFVYCAFDGEIARLELPRWLCEDKNEFEKALSALARQVGRGAGYPVVLAEAHHQAVIKGPDRERFFSVLAQHFRSSGAKDVRTSVKASKKRFSAV